jgi:hypothetical protein
VSGICNGDPEMMFLHSYLNTAAFRYRQTGEYHRTLNLVDTEDARIQTNSVPFGSAWMRGFKPMEYARQLYNNLLEYNNFQLTNHIDYTLLRKDGLLISSGRSAYNSSPDYSVWVNDKTIVPADGWKCPDLLPQNPSLQELKNDIGKFIEKLKAGVELQTALLPPRPTTLLTHKKIVRNLLTPNRNLL